MRLRIIFTVLIIIAGISIQANKLHGSFDKKAFYAIVRAGNLDKINAQINTVKAASIPEKEAYEGTLLMKKAGLVSSPIKKLNNFKDGATKLEAAIKKESDNTEYYFLRLIIQEHAPKIVNYSDNIKNDCQYIRANFKKLSPEVQQAVIDYSKTSKNLTAGSF